MPDALRGHRRYGSESRVFDESGRDAMSPRMQADVLEQRTIFEKESGIALRLPLGEILGAFHPGGCFALVEDPRRTRRASILGMMVLRPANRAGNESWLARSARSDFIESSRSVRDWCFDVDGIGGSWPISGGNVLDAFRLALQYGTMDAVLAGAATVAREGLVAGARRGHLWQPYTPLSWAVLSPWRDTLEPAIAALRRDWQEIGVLSQRTYPAQIAISASGRVREGGSDILDARMFCDRHPDGAAMESYVLTSEAGASRLRERARARGKNADAILLAASTDGDPEAIDVARVPELLRARLGARLVEHDGGATTLEAFDEAGAIAQMNLTLLRGRCVREVIEATDRLDAKQHDEILGSWEGRPRLFPSDGKGLRETWQPVYALEEASPGGEAVCAVFDARA